MKIALKLGSIALFSLCFCTALPAQDEITGQAYTTLSATGNTRVEIPLFHSRIIRLPTSMKRVSVGNPEIGDLITIDSRQIYILGKSLGTTNVVLWDRSDKIIGVVNVEVTHDLNMLKSKLHDLLPGESIEVRSSSGSIVLSGQVSSATKVDAAVRIAETFLKKSKESDDTVPGNVLNMLQVGGAQQVMLSVQVAEIATTVLKRIDPQFKSFYNGSPWKIGAVNGGAAFPDAILSGGGNRVPIFGDLSEGLIGPAVSEFAPGLQTIPDKGIFASYLSGDYLFSMALDIAKNEGLAKVLAEPTLTTMTGQQATVLSGGEFPIPVAQQLGQTTIEYKEFGVALKFLPVVLDSGNISLKVNVSVSDLRTDNSFALGVANAGGGQQGDFSSTFLIPSLAKRSATSSVELRSGETMGIAGIISEQLRENIDKLPGLGSLPVLGALFRSQEFIKGQTELVIFVTPRLAKPIAADKIQLPTDNFVEPNDVDFYLMGRLEGVRQVEEVPSGGGVEAQFGHDI
jgi:pilus assembly protein CpaC